MSGRVFAGPAVSSTRQRAPNDQTSRDAVDMGLVREAARAKLFGGPSGPVRVGRHVILEEIGRGGMGIVYAAFDPSLERKVAIKLVGGRTSDDGARLLREGQALAKLSHPNVVQVFDIGSDGGQVYVAMEFIEGPTLAQWMTEADRPWRAVLEVFAQAGRGLAAAHATGLVHRDFKPQNVLLRGGTAAQVVDFGLARGGTPDALAQTTLEVLNSTDEHKTVPLTRTGAVMGTPAYMSPEQFRGQPVDARSDQFGFCVALFEALYGVRPFSGRTRAALAANVLSGQVCPLRSLPAHRVPARLYSVVVRGLQVAPELRYPSMAALLDALARAPRLRRVPAAVAATAAAALGLAAWAPAWDECDASAHWEGVWDAQSRERVNTAIVAVAPQRSWWRVATALDAEVSTWVALHREACLSTDDDALVDLRRACLRQRRDAVAAVVDVLASTGAADVVDVLDPVADCGDAAYLGARTRPPGAEVQQQVAALRYDIVRAQAEVVAGSYARAEGRLAAIGPLVVATDYAPLQVDWDYRRGNVHEARGEFRAASRAYNAALWAAAEVGYDEMVGWSANHLAYLTGVVFARDIEGLTWSRHAETALARHGRAPDLAAAIAGTRGAIERTRGDAATAVRSLHNGVRLAVEAFGPHHPNTAAARSNLGAALFDAGRLTEAQVVHERALEDRRRELGGDHPAVATSLSNLAAIHIEREEHERAGHLLEQALDLLERAFGPNHPGVGDTLGNLGVLRAGQGRYAEAEEVDARAVHVYRVAFAEPPPQLALVLGNWADVLVQRGAPDAAVAKYREALGVADEALAPDAGGRGVLLTGLGGVLLTLQRPVEAVAPLEEAVRIKALNAFAADDLHQTQRMLGRARAEATRRPVPGAQ